MRLYLINPANPLVSIHRNKSSYWNRYRVWKPLSLLVLAALTPPDWEVSILDENLGPVDYPSLPRPDLVGITAFTSQADRAYGLAAYFRHLGVPVVMGGIHATMCLDEALARVDAVVAGEAEEIWSQVLQDVQHGRLQRCYRGQPASMDAVPCARHDLLTTGYAFGAIQTSRGCPLNCSFCSVTAFNGARFRQRPIPAVVEEFWTIPEKRVLVVDDNLIGVTPAQTARAKELFRALAAAGTGKEWICQASINIADDEELLDLAARAGCVGVFIGFESPAPATRPQLGKKADLLTSRDLPAAVARIRRRNIMVVGSFILGLDEDTPGSGKRIAEAASCYGVDNLNVLFLTPLPGTKLWRQFEAEGRIALQDFPQDWKYYTLTYPVGRYKHLPLSTAIAEMINCNKCFYSLPSIFSRLGHTLLERRNPVYTLASNLSSRRNYRLLSEAYADFQGTMGHRFAPERALAPQIRHPATEV